MVGVLEVLTVVTVKELSICLMLLGVLKNEQEIIKNQRHWRHLSLQVIHHMTGSILCH